MTRIVTRTLACGMPLLVEQNPGVRSAGITWLLPAGSAAEPVDRQGLAALWAELLFRGAGERTSRQHADEMDRLGVNRSSEVMTYHLRLGATMVGDRLLDALPLIVDMVRRPRFDADAIEPARDLALQAIESLQDDPQERAVLGARLRHFPAPLNRSSLGTVAGLRAATRDDIVGRWHALARPGRSIFAAAGAVDPDALAKRLDELLAGWEGTTDEPAVTGEPERGYAHDAEETNQVQIVVMHDAPPEPHPASMNEKMVLSVLSGGMAGRLFTEVREKRGLCYSVSASYSAGRDRGSVLGYVGTTPERAQQSLDVLMEELRRVNTPDGAIDAEELERAKVGMKSRLVFSGESTSARAAALALDQHRLGRPRSLEELAARVDAVTLEDVNAHLRTRVLGPLTIQTVGPAALTPPAE